MKNYKINIFFLFCAAGIFFFCGCSSSSNSIRYAEKKSEDNSSPTIRYNSDADDGDLPANEKSVDISSIVKDNLSYSNSTLKEKVLMEVIKYLNTPYQYGGDTKRGIDCSAFTQKIYAKSLSISLYRTASRQYTEGTEVDDIDELKFGDLVFFDTRSRVKPGHVGIYLGDKLFAHASSSKGVIVSSFDTNYYTERFMGGRRIENVFGSR